MQDISRVFVSPILGIVFAAVAMAVPFSAFPNKVCGDQGALVCVWKRFKRALSTSVSFTLPV